jgi:hypothetical protein
MIEIDPVAGFRVVRADPASVEDQIRPRRRRGNASAYGLLVFAVGLFLSAPVVAFMW